MRTMIVTGIIAILLGLVLLQAFGCPSGTVPYEGTCAADLKPEGVATSSPTLDPKIVSDERPSHHPEPAYLRGEVIADNPPSCAYTRACSDDVAINAAKEGKRKAGVPE